MRVVYDQDVVVFCVYSVSRCRYIFPLCRSNDDFYVVINVVF